MDQEKKYDRWRMMLIFGLVLWFPFLGFVVLGNGLIGAGAGLEAENIQKYGDLLILMYLGALPLGLSCFYLAKRNKQANIRSATAALRIPFMYLMAFLIVYFSVIPLN